MPSIDAPVTSPEGEVPISEPANDEKRDRILRAALEVCSQKGVAAARMEEIAARAEVSKGTLYRYFESKEDLLLATILASYVHGQRHVDAEKKAATDPREALALLCNGLTDVLMEVSAYSRVHYQAWGIVAGTPAYEAKLLDFLRNFHRQRDQEIVDLIRAGQAAGVFRNDVSPAIVADGVTALLSGFIYRSNFDPRSASREGLRACFDTLRGYLELPPR